MRHERKKKQNTHTAALTHRQQPTPAANSNAVGSERCQAACAQWQLFLEKKQCYHSPQLCIDPARLFNLNEILCIWKNLLYFLICI